MPTQKVVLDACVLVPVAPTDTLLRLAEKGRFRPLWSDRILDEAERAVRGLHPDMDPARRFASMRRAFPRSLVTGWEAHEQDTQLPDPNDRHVVAAAIRGGADTIVTANLQDFPAADLPPGLTAVHPDTFLCEQADLDPATVLQVIREQSAQTRNPHLTPEHVVAALEQAGLPRFADKMRELMSPAPDGSAVTSQGVQASPVVRGDEGRGTQDAPSAAAGERGAAAPEGVQTGRSGDQGPGQQGGGARQQRRGRQGSRRGRQAPRPGRFGRGEG
jgi:predicted nucleic acid-binding protein